MTAKTSPLPFGTARYREWLPEQMTAFEDAVRRGDPDARVPWAKRWRLRNLTEHLASVHRWAAEIVSTRKRPALWPKAPAGLDLPDLYRHAADLLLKALDEADPDSPCWVFGPGPRVTSFWFRRQTQETTVHLWDAGAAAGDPAPINPLIAADGIDEAFTVMLPRRHRWHEAELPELPGPLLIAPTDTAHRWLLTPEEGRPVPAVTLNPPAGDATAQVSGEAETLLLWIWGRIPPATDQITVTGDPSPFTAFIAAGITP